MRIQWSDGVGLHAKFVAVDDPFEFDAFSRWTDGAGGRRFAELEVQAGEGGHVVFTFWVQWRLASGSHLQVAGRRLCGA